MVSTRLQAKKRRLEMEQDDAATEESQSANREATGTEGADRALKTAHALPVRIVIIIFYFFIFYLFSNLFI